tara:strand:- start:1037 stop:1300 length:264 start_codon:yes stop_codon:yes gene_type:complete
MAKGYCLKCKKKVSMINPVASYVGSGVKKRLMKKGKCSSCKNKIQTLVKRTGDYAKNIRDLKKGKKLNPKSQKKVNKALKKLGYTKK